MNKLTVVFCCSGWLGEIALRAALRIRYIQVGLVMTDKRSAGIIRIARRRALPVFIGNPRGKTNLPALHCDVIAAVNYLFVLPGAMLKKARVLAFNIHGSLLPKYMGRTPVTWVIINDEIETGLTVHEMSAEVDCGPIIFQEKIPVSNGETGGGLLEKMSCRYPAVLRTIFRQIRDGSVKRIPQDLQKRTYFGKREPADGLIDWRWSARKVYNWVRAQTRPYPGAFGFIDKTKYRIWKVEELSGLIKPRKPGTVINKKGGLVITCGHGAVRLIDHSVERDERSFCFSPEKTSC